MSDPLTPPGPTAPAQRAVAGASSDSARPRSLRVGGIDYLNALPLTAYVEADGEPSLTVVERVPSALADGLRTGELDLALAPVVEYLESDQYRVLPGMCVSSYGAVQSVRLYCRDRLGAPSEVRRLALDVSSRTSAQLARLVLRRRFDADPQIQSIAPERAAQILMDTREGLDPDGDAEFDAILLIGDAALERPAAPGWRVLDLGNEWTRWTGLPFVYAVWMWRGDEPLPAGLLERFRRGRDVGRCRIDEIVRCWSHSRSIDEVTCREYLVRSIEYDLGAPQEQGLLRFFALLAEEGLISEAPTAIRYV